MLKKTSKETSIFHAKASKGFTFKVAIDSLATAMNSGRTVFKIDKNGIFHKNSDEAKHVLFDISLFREKFENYFCHREIIFSINLKHLKGIIKNIKRKDSITLYITEDNPNNLVIIIQPANVLSDNDSRIEKMHIVINIMDKDHFIDCPDIIEDENGKSINIYGYPKVIQSIEFQKIKKLTSIGKTVTIAIQKNNYISFQSSNGELYNSTISFGIMMDSPERAPDSDEEMDTWYTANFSMGILSLLMRLPSLCSHMRFYSPRISGYPLKVSMEAGNLGTICIYIKDLEQIEYEETKKRQNDLKE